MGSHRLRPIHASKFRSWVLRSGFTDEYHFWSSLSGLSSGTITDHMESYLGSLSYTGTPQDKLRKFLRDQTSNLGTTFDMGNQFFDGTFSAGSGAPVGSITDDDGNYIKDDDGNYVVDGS